MPVTNAPPTRAALIRAMAEAGYAIVYAKGTPGYNSWEDAHPSVAKLWLDLTEAVLTAIEAAGCRVVPVELTYAMIEGERFLPEAGFLEDAWAEMMKASPYAPEADG